MCEDCASMGRSSLSRKLILLTLTLGAACNPAPPPATPAPPPPLSPTPPPRLSPSPYLTLSPSPDPFAAARERLVQDGIIGWGIGDQAVIAAIRAVPRHEFVLPEYLDEAYQNYPLPIGYGQTISQPYIVALMSQALALGPGDRALEVGAGSGYQAAVLAALDVEVYTIEIIGALAESAGARLARLGYAGVQVRHADGYFGWPEAAPFDGIIVTAAPDHVPQPLLAQLRVGGRMVIPVGPVGGVQTLWLVTRDGEDQYRSENLGAVRFVPLTREQR